MLVHDEVYAGYIASVVLFSVGVALLGWVS